MDYNIQTLKEKIKSVIETNNGLNLIDSEYPDIKKKIKLEYLESSKKLTKTDHYNYHVFLERIYKTGKLPKHIPISEQIKMERENKPLDNGYIPMECLSKEKSFTNLTNFLDNLKRNAKYALSYFYGNGEQYGFNEHDGEIELRYVIIEKEKYYDICAYYSYYGK